MSGVKEIIKQQYIHIMYVYNNIYNIYNFSYTYTTCKCNVIYIKANMPLRVVIYKLFGLFNIY